MVADGSETEDPTEENEEQRRARSKAEKARATADGCTREVVLVLARSVN